MSRAPLTRCTPRTAGAFLLGGECLGELLLYERATWAAPAQVGRGAERNQPAQVGRGARRNPLVVLSKSENLVHTVTTIRSAGVR
jgi:hypothetical protein